MLITASNAYKLPVAFKTQNVMSGVSCCSIFAIKWLLNVHDAKFTMENLLFQTLFTQLFTQNEKRAVELR